VQDERLYVKELDGPEPTVVFVHGVMDRSTSFLKSLKYLPPYRFVLFDRRGYGRSLRAPVSGGHISTNLDDIRSLVPASGAVLVGHSLGALLVLLFAKSYPELARSVLAYEPPLSFRGSWHGAFSQASKEARSVEELVDGFMARMIGAERYASLGEAVRRQLYAQGPTMAAELSEARSLPADLTFSDVVVPVVIGVGSESPERHRKAAQELAAEIPNSRLRVVPSVGHGAHIQAPEAFADLVKEAIALAEQGLG
jgi:3-oxoadipate enol-lactonase